jgi:hypothetical protein
LPWYIKYECEHSTSGGTDIGKQAVLCTAVPTAYTLERPFPKMVITMQFEVLTGATED